MTSFEQTTLSNGLRVLTAPMAQAKSVACFVMLAAGSRYETREAGGIAHFAEHMFFKGTERRPTARHISGEIDAIGGEFNAFTGKEYTGYYVKCAAEHRDVALDVLVDMLRHSKFEPDEIEREKGVIIEELNMYVDTPRDYVDGVYDQLLFDDQPLGRDIIGTKETIRAATRDTFLAYLDRWYRAPRMVAGVAGALGDDLVPRLESLLGDVQDGSSAGPEQARLEQSAARVKVHTKQSDQAHLRFGVPSYPIDHPDRYALGLLSTVLGGGMSSRLFTEVRERRGLAYYVFSHNMGYTDTGTLYAQAGVDIARIDDAISTIVQEFTRIAAEPVGAEELQKAKNFVKGRLVLSLEDPKGLILFGLRGEVLEGRVREVEEVLAGFDAVTAGDVQRVGQDLIREDRLNLALIGPFDGPEPFEKLLVLSS
ncbi:MAG: pitrilysin family protein [Gaiellales bacterium]